MSAKKTADKKLSFDERKGATSRVNAFNFDPDTLVFAKSEKSATFDERAQEALKEEFVTSVIVYGVLTPITVRKNGERNGVDINEIVYGRKRTLAAREANRRMVRIGELLKKSAKPQRIAEEFKTDAESVAIWVDAFKARNWARYEVPGIRPSLGDDENVRGIVITENEQRTEDTVMTRARKASRMLAAGSSARVVGVAFGVTAQTITDWAALVNDCAAEVHAAVDAGTITPTVARKALAKLPREEQGAKLKELVAAGATKGRAADAAAKQIARGEPVRREKPTEYVVVMEAACSGPNGRAQETVTLKTLDGEKPRGAKLVVFRAWRVA